MVRRVHDITLSTKSGATLAELMVAQRDSGKGVMVPAWQESRERPYVDAVRTGVASLDDTDPLRDLTFAQHDWQGGAAVHTYSEEGKNGYSESSWDMMWPHVAKPGIPRNYGDQRGNTGAPVGLIIHNPFFEVNSQGADGWIEYSTPLSVDYYATNDPRTALLGNHHARVETNGANEGIQYQIITSGAFLTDFRSKAVTVSAYVKRVSGTGTIFVGLRDADAGANATSDYHAGVTASTYTLASVSHTVQNDAISLYVVIYTDNSGTKFDVDDVSVYVNNATATRAVVFRDGVYQAFGRTVCKLLTTDDHMVWQPVYIHASASCTDLEVYKGYIYAAFGASAAYIYSIDGTTWTAAAGGSGNDTYAIKLVTSRNRLFKAETHNSIRSSTTNPTTGADWETAYTVGSDTTEIVKLFDYLDTVWVGKEDGLWSFLANYEDGYAGNVFINQIPEYATNTTTENFSRGVVHDKALWLKPAAVGLRRITGYDDQNLSDLVTRPASNLTGNVRTMCSFYDRLFMFVDDQLFAIRNRLNGGDQQFVKHSMISPTVSNSIVAQSQAVAATISATSGGTFSGWTNSSNVVSSNDTYATDSVAQFGTSNTLLVTNFTFTGLPNTAVIDGITVSVEHKKSSATQVFMYAQLRYGGAAIGNNQSHSCTHDSSNETATTLGGSTDLWGTAVSATEVNTSTFGVGVYFSDLAGFLGVADTLSIDHVTVAIAYHLPVTQVDGINVSESIVATWSTGSPATTKPHLIGTLDGVESGGQVLAFSDVWALPERGALATDVNATPVLTTSWWDGGFPSDNKALDYIEVLLTDPDVAQTIVVKYGKDGQDPDSITFGTIATNNFSQRLYSYGLTNYETDAIGKKFQFTFTGANISDMGIDGFVVHTRLLPGNIPKIWEVHLLLGGYQNTGLQPNKSVPELTTLLLSLESTGTALTLAEDFDGDGTDSTRYVAIVPGSVARSYDKSFQIGPNQEVWRVLLREVKVSD